MTIRTTLALLALTLAAQSLGAKSRDEVPPGTPDGKAQSCIPIIGIRESKVRDDRTIDFFIGRRVYRNVLPNSCPSLGFERAFSYETSLSQLCSTDIIHVFRQGMPQMRGASCGLGQFQPVTGVK
jgi:hypothetical protein